MTQLNRLTRKEERNEENKRGRASSLFFDRFLKQSNAHRNIPHDQRLSLKQLGSLLDISTKQQQNKNKTKIRKQMGSVGKPKRFLLSDTHTHACMCTHTRTHTHTRTYTHTHTRTRAQQCCMAAATTDLRSFSASINGCSTSREFTFSWCRYLEAANQE